MTAYRSFSKIPRLAYGLIMADPPWDFEIWSQAGEHKSPHKQYDCVSTNALEHLPLGDVAR
ncbi:MAG: DNA methyltransferase, partial [Pseudomonadota bacterium]